MQVKKYSMGPLSQNRKNIKDKTSSSIFMEMALCLELGGQDSNLKLFHFLHGFFASSQPNLSIAIRVQTNVANRAST